MAIVNHYIDIKYCLKVDTDTGEILETKIVEKVPKKVPVDENTTPTISLTENKLVLNQAAITLMDIAAGVKLDIKYEKSNPVIGTNEAFGTKGGCLLTKSNSVSYRGAKNETLAKYGDEFIVEKHPTTAGLFILKGNKIQEVVSDENINLDSTDEEFDLSDLIDGEIDSSFFKL